MAILSVAFKTFRTSIFSWIICFFDLETEWNSALRYHAPAIACGVIHETSEPIWVDWIPQVNWIRTNSARAFSMATRPWRGSSARRRRPTRSAHRTAPLAVRETAQHEGSTTRPKMKTKTKEVNQETVHTRQEICSLGPWVHLRRKPLHAVYFPVIPILFVADSVSWVEYRRALSLHFPLSSNPKFNKIAVNWSSHSIFVQKFCDSPSRHRNPKVKT